MNGVSNRSQMGKTFSFPDVVNKLSRKQRNYLVICKKGSTFATANNKQAPLAQLVEHLTLNQGVQGSSP